ncbi:hypothetical protein K461DRAFT_280233 [Myriangium duriaei CBS 260.36]|uniref:Bulb-type lectin domain-containing protein n=1 Tax=Myriangium duriaei CBS 260.36 TaxID=1168546 RepID=A0A9P4J2Y8_9PEZI|nr:hypothetical protein K461DRAFT_280233 [Myriangium duriaei CBS 260.36]
MRLGQGFNSYTQQICVDDAVVVDPQRAENVITNDGTTMRIVAEASGKPSAWNRLKEVVGDGPDTVKSLSASTEPEINAATTGADTTTSDLPSSATESSKSSEEDQSAASDDKASSEEQAASSKEDATAADSKGDEPDATKTDQAVHTDDSTSDTGSAVVVAKDDIKEASSTTAETSAPEEPLEKEQSENTKPTNVDVTDAASATSTEVTAKTSTRAKPNSTSIKSRTRSSSVGKVTISDDNEATTPKSAVPSKKIAIKDTPSATGATTTITPEAKGTTGSLTTVAPATATRSRTRSSSVDNKQIAAQKPAKGSAKYRVAEIPVRGPKTPVAASKPPTAEELEQARLDKAERLEMMRQEKERLAEQRKHQMQIEQESREEERTRRQEEREEAAAVRKEKREYEAARRAAMQKSISEAVAAKKDALTLEDLNKIKAQNQFADRFEGIVSSDERYSFDAATASRGPSQTVVYSSRFIDKLSDVTDDMCISGALSVKMAKIGGSGRGSFVDSDKFKQSDLNFYISVKVVNQTVNFKDALQYNRMRSVEPGSDDFNKVYGDSFISGFVEGGEFNAIVSMKVHNKAKLMDIKAEAKVALTAGPVDITAEANVGIARTNLEMNTETTIQVSWCGGGHIKPMEQPWNIQTIMQAAARFPSLVANCPQRTHAILTKYDSLRSFVDLRPAAYSPLQYENAQIYTNVLMDAFMSYKALYKKLGDHIQGVQSETLEFQAWSGDDGDNTSDGKTSPSNASSSQALTMIGQAAASGDQRALLAAKKYAAALAAATDVSRFEASVRGLSDARKFIRRQMVYIVNEVDLIEKDPKVATDEDHDEPFQSPSLFETRVPVVQIPERLKPKPNPISGKRIYAKTQTEDELKEEQREQDELQNASPALYSMDQDLSTSETASLDEARKRTPMIGKYLQASRAMPKTEKGNLFNNLDFLYPEWRVESVTIGIDGLGAVTFVEVVYENGLIIKKGPRSNNTVTKTLSSFQQGERIIAVAIETGARAAAPEELKVLSVCMWTNRGRRLLGQAAQNELLKNGNVTKSGCEYTNIHSLYLDCPFKAGTFKGFFGLVDMDSEKGGMQRLGVIWGDETSTDLPPSLQKGALAYDTDPSTVDATVNAIKYERDQAITASQSAIAEAKRAADDQVKRESERLATDFKTRYDAGIASAIQDNKQIKFANNVYTGRQSVSFRGDTFKASPSMTPFLIFENGNQFKYQPDGNLVVYSRSGAVMWAMDRYGPGAGDLIFHGGNDGNLVAWKQGGATWATETKDCRDGFLVFSSEKPYLEIFTRDGQRRCHYPTHY